MRSSSRARILWLWVLVSILALSAACSGPGGAGKSVNPETVAMDFTTAFLQGDLEKAKEFIKAEAMEKVSQKLDKSAAIMGQYETTNLEIGSTRPWSFGGESDKRVEIRFDFRRKGASDEQWSIGLLAVRVVTTGGTWKITDLELVRPAK